MHSIIIECDEAGFEMPVAFMVMRVSCKVPLAQWLQLLKNTVVFEKQPIFMIDCSRTEVAVIKVVFQVLSIHFFHWNSWRVLNSQVISKISVINEGNFALNDSRPFLRAGILN